MIDTSLLPNGRHKRLASHGQGTGQGILPLGLLPVPNVGQGARSVYQPPVFAFQEEDSDCGEPLYYSRQSAAYAGDKKKAVTLPFSEIQKRQGFALHRFRSGELTGARFTTGLASAVSLNPRSGVVITQSLTQKARTKIRRAIQNADCNFKCFLTVTFSPQHLNPWELASDGSVRHDFAKYKFKKFLNSVKHSYDRKADKSGRDSDRLSYVWVAEIQIKTTKNIHFHVLLNQRPPIKWLSALWSQAANSIDVRSINNLNHASCYIRKYLEKDKSNIQGNRYAITQGLRKSMEPVKTVINGREEQRGVFSIVRDLVDTIELNGGKVLEHGFFLPTPCRSVSFRGKDGKVKKSIAVSAGLSVYILDQINAFSPVLPF